MRRLTHRSLTLLSVFHLSIASRKDFNDFSTALFFPRASAVPEMTMHRGCADAIVHGVLQQGDDHQGDAWAHLSAPHFARTQLILRSFAPLSIGVGLLWYYVVIPGLLRGKA